MGCNCGKKKQQEEPVVVPQTPDELLNQELKIWGGGVNININLNDIKNEESNNEGPDGN